MPSTRIARAAGLVAAALVMASVTARAVAAQDTSGVRQQSRQSESAAVASQLGAKLGPSQSEELPLGTSVTATLDDPGKLATLGLSGMHQGARVTVTRIARDRVRVEVDELEPVMLTRKITLRLNADGRLTSLAP